MLQVLEEQIFMEWFLEDDEPQPQKVRMTLSVKKAVEKIHIIITNKAQKAMSKLEQLLLMPSIMDDINRKYDAINNIRRVLDNESELTLYLRKNSLYDFYMALLDYVEIHLSFESLSNNLDDLTFFTNKNELIRIMQNRGIRTDEDDINKKLRFLASLGMIKALTNSEIRPDVLQKAYKINELMSYQYNKKLYRTSFYMIYNLNYVTVSEILKRIDLFKHHGLTRKDINAIRIASILGEDTVKNDIIIQKDFSINPTKARNFINAANILLNKQQYFTLEQLRKQYCYKDHNIVKSDAIPLTRNYLSIVIKEHDLIRVRVNRYYRDKYSIPNSISSNSYIFIRKI